MMGLVAPKSSHIFVTNEYYVFNRYFTIPFCLTRERFKPNPHPRMYASGLTRIFSLMNTDAVKLFKIKSNHIYLFTIYNQSYKV